MMNKQICGHANMRATDKTRFGKKANKGRLFPITLLVLCMGLSSVSYIAQAAALPSVTLSRTSGPPASPVTVSVFGFAPNTLTAILFDYAFVDEVFTSAAGAFTRSITIPATAPGGIHRITVNDGVNSVDATFTVTSQTLITLSPAMGSTSTGVTISGSNFGANKVIAIRFDNSIIATNPASVLSSHTGTFSAVITIPSTAVAGSHTVTASDGTLITSALFNVSGSSLVTLSPTSGAAGTVVTVTGSGFAGTSSVTIRFDSTTLVTTPTSIVTTTSGTFSATIAIPTGVATGSHTISAMDISGRSGSAIFNITTSGTLALSSNTGMPGSSVTISGSGYAPNSIINVKFDSITLFTSPATVTTNIAGSFTATVTIPTGAAIGSHTMSATDASGRIASAVFYVGTAGVITISPITGPTGTEVTVTGSGFAPNTKVSIKFGDISVRTFPLEVVTGSTGTFIAMVDVPAGVSGTHSVTARDDTGRTGTAAFTVTGLGRTISLSTTGTGGTITGGTNIMITGSGFAPHTVITIRFDGETIATDPSRITTTSTDTFTATIAVPTTASVGSHTIRATGNGDSAFATFNVLSRLQSSITLSSTTVIAGSPLTVSGSGFAPNKGIAIEIDNNILVMTETSSAGIFTITFNIPTTITAGRHSISANDGMNTVSATISIIEMTQDIVDLTDLRLVDQRGSSLSRISEGTQVLIQSDLRNNLSTDQRFVYIVQVKDSEGSTLMISWISGTLPGGKQYAVAQSWLAEEKGRYDVEIFTWESISNPVVLAPSVKTIIRVS